MNRSITLGRQILTWGTGDLVFINDLFPKDWVSFFIGRDVEYLKAPSDALKVSAFSSWANLDLVYTPPGLTRIASSTVAVSLSSTQGKGG